MSDYLNYLADYLTQNISYTEYIAENLDKSIDYSNYLADQIDNSIDYSEYLSEAMYNPEKDRIRKEKRRIRQNDTGNMGYVFKHAHQKEKQHNFSF